MSHLILLHTNDIHGRIEGLARVVTLVEETRQAHPAATVLYLDAGDIEETANRLSNLTKGVAMHQLLSVAGCAVATVGNAAWIRYGPQVLADEAAVATYPLLLGNLRTPEGAPLPGVQPTALLDAGGLGLGVIGVSAEFPDVQRLFGLQTVSLLPLIRDCAAALRQAGAGAVLLLSHMGLPLDRELAAGLQEDVDLIIGAHTHDLLPEGEWVGRVLIAQAGEYAQHLGRVDLEWTEAGITRRQALVLPVPDTTAPDPAMLAAAAAAEAAVTAFLATPIGELAAPLDYASDRECGMGNLMADVLRERMAADVAVASVGQAFSGPLPAGIVRRVMVWDVCDSPANPGVVTLTGAQLLALLRRGLDPAFAAERPRPLRGRARGLFHLSGATVRAGQVWVGDTPLDPDRAYRVAASDWELEPYGGYAPAEWALTVHYHAPTILREAVEEYLVRHRPVVVAPGRLDGSPLA